MPGARQLPWATPMPYHVRMSNPGTGVCQKEGSIAGVEEQNGPSLSAVICGREGVGAKRLPSCVIPEMSANDNLRQREGERLYLWMSDVQLPAHPHSCPQSQPECCRLPQRPSCFMVLHRMAVSTSRLLVTVQAVTPQPRRATASRCCSFTACRIVRMPLETRAQTCH